MTDPRVEPNFEPHFFPQCHHAPFPDLDGADQARWLIKLEFLTAYYMINRLAARLHVLRQAELASGSRSAIEDAEAALEKAIAAKNALDAQYARQGITATPSWNGRQFDDVAFSFPPGQAARLQVHFCVPPPGARP